MLAVVLQPGVVQCLPVGQSKIAMPAAKFNVVVNDRHCDKTFTCRNNSRCRDVFTYLGLQCVTPDKDARQK